MIENSYGASIESEVMRAIGILRGYAIGTMEFGDKEDINVLTQIMDRAEKEIEKTRDLIKEK